MCRAAIHVYRWIDMSVKDGMDGGWFFPVPMALSLCIDAADPGTPTQQLAEWFDFLCFCVDFVFFLEIEIIFFCLFDVFRAAQHGVEQCLAVGRDMGAAPPRQVKL